MAVRKELVESVSSTCAGLINRLQSVLLPVNEEEEEEEEEGTHALSLSLSLCPVLFLLCVNLFLFLSLRTWSSVGGSSPHVVSLPPPLCLTPLLYVSLH